MRIRWTHTPTSKGLQSNALFSHFVEINLHICRRATVCHFNPFPATHFLVPRLLGTERRESLSLTVQYQPTRFCLLKLLRMNGVSVQSWPWPPCHRALPVLQIPPDKYEFFNNVSIECSTECSLLRSELEFLREKWFRAGTGKTSGRRDLACLWILAPEKNCLHAGFPVSSAP